MKRTAAQLQEDLLAIWRAGVDAVDSERLLRENVELVGNFLRLADIELDLAEIDRIYVVGAGKAGAGMAAGLEAALGADLMQAKQVRGLLSVPEDCVRRLSRIELRGGRPAGVNAPTEAGVQIASEILDGVGRLNERDLCIALISGGGSALLPAPIAGVTLADKQAITKYLSGAGADIVHLNTVRKQLSRIKGNGLAVACRAGYLVSMIISDVLGDPLDVIASGPTVPDSSSAADALQILRDFGAAGLPQFAAIVSVLQQKQKSAPQPTCDVYNFVIGNNAVAVDAAGIEAERRGYSHAMTSARQSEGQAEAVGRHLAEMTLRMRDSKGPDCLITGGEPVVQLADEAERGMGGRNQQLTLAAYKRLCELSPTDPMQGMAILSGGTDGEDGPTDAAGAWIDAAGSTQAQELQLSAEDYLRRNDAYHFFQPLDRLLKTGPTHTNVCDLRVAVVDRIETASRK
ncbi:DUF4147 domain-containing protein [Blastopirellula sp. JC732]|uniref:DUF4147 domain-containing protein n=1 Tax=Blastopirellula sediminis TaxID=2894196 RepID=A0A9X1SGT3_9BACT|nr:DUF4147 domain-containing protein [Blastopirellula sediminis]MCC9606992.1 DUF4147 domain-containing protein [Blastopirellula sediminis]MCC9629713.1 DUF4147 domain-containing protein [Blastopirellula sediminis]